MRQFKYKYLLISFLFLIIIVVSGVYYYQRQQANKTPQGVLVSVGEAVSKDLAVTVEALGTVEAYRSVSIRALVEGTLEKVAFQEGDHVKAGQLLFKIDPRAYQAQLNQAKAKLVSDQAQLVNAQTIVERNKALLKKGYASQQDFDTFIANAAVLMASVQADQAAVDNAQLQLDYCTIPSPINGRTGAILLHEGNMVKANDSTALVVINQLAPIYVKFSLPEHQLRVLQKEFAQEPVKVVAKAEKNGPNIAIGQLSFIDNTVDSSTGMIQLKAIFTNEMQQLWPGEFVILELPLAKLAQAVMVPTGAVQSGQTGEYVYLIDAVKNRVIYQPVTVGIAQNGETQIVRGLKPGNKVVTEGQLKLVDGTMVRFSG